MASPIGRDLGGIAELRKDARLAQRDEAERDAERRSRQHIAPDARIADVPAISRDQPSRLSGQNLRTYGSSAR